MHHVSLALMVFAQSAMVGCASMSKLDYNYPSERRNVCQRFSDDAASFVGQQQFWGVIFGAVAATSVGLGAAVSDDDTGGTWEENRKTILLTTAIPASLLAYNFLGNASSAATSSSAASAALADNNDDRMWAACQRARALYWDGRLANLASTSERLGTPSTPEQRERTGYTDVADALADGAAAENTKVAQNLAAAEATRPPDERALSKNLKTARSLADNVREASEATRKAAAEVRSAVESSNKTAARAQLSTAQASSDETATLAAQAQTAIEEYLAEEQPAPPKKR